MRLQPSWHRMGGLSRRSGNCPPASSSENPSGWMGLFFSVFYLAGVVAPVVAGWIATAVGVARHSTSDGDANALLPTGSSRGSVSVQRQRRG